MIKKFLNKLNIIMIMIMMMMIMIMMIIIIIIISDLISIDNYAFLHVLFSLQVLV